MKKPRRERPRNHFARELLTNGEFRPKVVPVKMKKLPRKEKHKKEREIES